MLPDYSTYTDSALFAVLMSGASSAELAFGEIYKRHSRRLYLYCTKITGNKQDAHDIFQEAWIKFHSVATSTQTCVENVAGYIFRIARNLYLNKKNERQIDIVTYEDVYSSSKANQLENMEQLEVVEMLKRALDLLDDDYREAYVLHELDDMPYEEISAITGSTVAALKNRVWRARKHIRTYLAPLLSSS
ncbi:MAG: RNA polymerase sigma factor [Bacteroidetes bacterium]|nr:RNA polymerase sigma factor [Bacteroidota bacterium]